MRIAENKCLDCGKKINQISKRCKSCSNKFRKGKFKIKNNLGFNKGNKHYNWKGNNVKYNSLHLWIRKQIPKPKFCEDCGKNEPQQIANISGQYSRDLTDWKWLCIKCHSKFDYNPKKNAEWLKTAKRDKKGRLIKRKRRELPCE